MKKHEILEKNIKTIPTNIKSIKRLPFYIKKQFIPNLKKYKKR